MTTRTPVRMVGDMPKLLRRRHRDTYLRRLHDDPLFRDVQRHLVPVIGRIVDLIVLAPGVTTPCPGHGQVVVITEGEAVLRDGQHRPIAVLGPGTVLGHPRSTLEQDRAAMTTISDLRGYAIPRREVATLATIAPAFAAALARAEHVDCETRHSSSSSSSSPVASSPDAAASATASVA